MVSSAARIGLSYARDLSCPFWKHVKPVYTLFTIVSLYQTQVGGGCPTSAGSFLDAHQLLGMAADVGSGQRLLCGKKTVGTRDTAKVSVLQPRRAVSMAKQGPRVRNASGLVRSRSLQIFCTQTLAHCPSPIFAPPTLLDQLTTPRRRCRRLLLCWRVARGERTRACTMLERFLLRLRCMRAVEARPALVKACMRYAGLSAVDSARRRDDGCKQAVCMKTCLLSRMPSQPSEGSSRDSKPQTEEWPVGRAGALRLASAGSGLTHLSRFRPPRLRRRRSSSGCPKELGKFQTGGGN